MNFYEFQDTDRRYGDDPDDQNMRVLLRLLIGCRTVRMTILAVWNYIYTPDAHRALLMCIEDLHYAERFMANLLMQYKGVKPATIQQTEHEIDKGIDPRPRGPEHYVGHLKKLRKSHLGPLQDNFNSVARMITSTTGGSKQFKDVVKRVDNAVYDFDRALKILT